MVAMSSRVACLPLNTSPLGITRQMASGSSGLSGKTLECSMILSGRHSIGSLSTRSSGLTKASSPRKLLMLLDTLIAVEEAAQDNPDSLIVTAIHAGHGDPMQALLHAWRTRMPPVGIQSFTPSAL